jgi:hypothetical protein
MVSFAAICAVLQAFPPRPHGVFFYSHPHGILFFAALTWIILFDLSAVAGEMEEETAVAEDLQLLADFVANVPIAGMQC